MTPQTLQVDADTNLALRIYEPPGAARGSVVMGGAMGVRQNFYAVFATWLAELGYRVTTFDFRGQGDSLTGPMGRVRADLLDWVRDYEAVIAAAKSALPTQPLYLIGHSLCAQLPGLMRDTSAVDGMLAIASGSGYWRDNAPQLRRVVLIFWYLLAPLSTAVCGYFPGGRLGVIGNLPKGVIQQWRRWCLNPRYSMGAEGAGAVLSYAAVRFPIVAFSMADDEMMSLQGIAHLMGFYANASSRIETIAPRDAQCQKLGHMGFFRKSNAVHLWPRAEAVLASFARSGVASTTA